MKEEENSEWTWVKKFYDEDCEENGGEWRIPSKTCGLEFEFKLFEKEWRKELKL